MRATHRALKLLVVASMVLATLGLSAFSAGAITLQATIDFESGLSAGTIPTVLDVGTGITGDDLGSVGVQGFRTDLPGVNQAMIFDATCGGGPASNCSGGDADLFVPGQGNVLIISEDGDQSDPDDADVGERFDFDFSGWGPTGVVTVVSIDVLDVEADESPGAIEIGGVAVPIPQIGDNNVMTIPVGGTGSLLQVFLNGSGAIDNIVIEVDMDEPGGGEGCTPGYWRQAHHFDSWTAYQPHDSFDAVFGVSYGGTLLDGVWARGGQENALARHAVAALLNAASPDVPYEYTEVEIIALVQGAFASGDFNGAKNLLEFQNELGCPLD